MERLSDKSINIIDELHTERLDYYSEYIPLIDAINLLAEYEDTGLTPQEIEHMKARMPLHKWAGESPDKMSIFGVTVAEIMEWVNANKDGRLIVLSIKDMYPCENCDIGWRVYSDQGMITCQETCIELQQYNEKYNI
jgi:hypothetical protein